MAVEKTYVVGTANIRHSTATFLDRMCEDADLVGDHPTLAVYSKREYGWFVSVPGRTVLESMIDNPQTPAELIGLVWIAIANDCEWLQIDRDMTDESLPVWDW